MYLSLSLYIYIYISYGVHVCALQAPSLCLARSSGASVELPVIVTTCSCVCFSLHFSTCACRPCAGAMLILSFRFKRMIPTATEEAHRLYYSVLTKYFHKPTPRYRFGESLGPAEERLFLACPLQALPPSLAKKIAVALSQRELRIDLCKLQQ